MALGRQEEEGSSSSKRSGRRIRHCMTASLYGGSREAGRRGLGCSWPSGLRTLFALSGGHVGGANVVSWNWPNRKHSSDGNGGHIDWNSEEDLDGIANLLHRRFLTLAGEGITEIRAVPEWISRGLPSLRDLRAFASLPGGGEVAGEHISVDQLEEFGCFDGDDSGYSKKLLHGKGPWEIDIVARGTAAAAFQLPPATTMFSSLRDQDRDGQPSTEEEEEELEPSDLATLSTSNSSSLQHEGVAADISLPVPTRSSS